MSRTATQPLVTFACSHPSGCRNAVRATPESVVVCNAHPRARRMEPTHEAPEGAQ